MFSINTTTINIRDIDYAYVEETPLITVGHREISDTERRIGEIVASRIDDYRYY